MNDTLTLASWFTGLFETFGVDITCDYFTPQMIIVILGFVYIVSVMFNMISSLFDLCKGR